MRGSAFVLGFVLLLWFPSVLLGQGATIEQEYTWTYGGRSWALTYRFSTEHYQFFRTLPRTLDYTRYTEYIEDPRDDQQLDGLLAALHRLAASAGLCPRETLHLVIAFVQAIPYAGEPCEYPRYPLETLVEKRGDCEDSAILAAALLQRMRFDVVLLAFLDEKHMALGIATAPPAAVDRPPYAWNGSSYYFVETTSVGWGIGEIPPYYRSDPTVLSLRPVVVSSQR